VVLPRDVFREIASTQHPTLRDFLNSIPEKVGLTRVDDPGLELDIDRPADYEKALRLAQNQT
jgi:CTP:molybdopterin cytidylyltransferase MocA